MNLSPLRFHAVPTLLLLLAAACGGGGDGALDSAADGGHGMEETIDAAQGAADGGEDAVDSGPDVEGSEDSVTALITAAEGGTLEISEGALAGLIFTVPAGALSEDTEITLSLGGANTHGSSLEMPGNPALLTDAVQMLDNMVGDWSELSYFGVLLTLENLREKGLLPEGRTLVMEPSGLAFSIPATLQLPYGELSTEEAPISAASAHWLVVAHVSDFYPTRMLLPSSVDPERQTLTVQVEHFSELGIGQFFQFLGEALLSAGAAHSEGTMAIAQANYEGNLRHIYDTVDGLVEAFSDSALIESLSADLATQLACLDAEIDTEVPADAVGMQDLLTALTMMGAVAGRPWEWTGSALAIEDAQFAAQTGHEGGWLEAMASSTEPVSFGEAFAMALDLSGGNAHDAFMTMHNVGQGVSRTPLFAHLEWMSNTPGELPVAQKLTALEGNMQPLTGIDPRITDTRGAWYHMTGLAALSMRTGGGLPLVMATFDEAINSGLKGGDFEVGEQIANMIGSSLGQKVAELAATAEEDDLCEELVVEITSPTDGQIVGDTPTVEIQGTVNVATVEEVEVSYGGDTFVAAVVDGAFSATISIGDDNRHEFVISAQAIGDRQASDQVVVLREVELWFCTRSYGGTGGVAPESLPWLCSLNNDDVPAMMEIQYERSTSSEEWFTETRLIISKTVFQAADRSTNRNFYYDGQAILYRDYAADVAIRTYYRNLNSSGEPTGSVRNHTYVIPQTSTTLVRTSLPQTIERFGLVYGVEVYE